MYAWYEELQRTDNNTNKYLMKPSLLWARASARCLNFDMACILLPICHNLLSIMKKLSALVLPRRVSALISLEKSKKFHEIVAYTMAFFTIIHTVAHMINYWQLVKFMPRDLISCVSLLWTTWSGVTGQVMIFILVLLISTSQKPVRTQAFELFWYIHHLSMVFFAAILLHTYGCLLKTDDLTCYQKTSWKWIMLGVLVYACEKISRLYRSHRFTYINKVIQHPHKVIELQFKRDGMEKVTAGQYVYLNFPDLVTETGGCSAGFEWHPYTLTSCSFDNMQSVHIHVVGDWTEALAKRVGCMDNDGKWVHNVNNIGGMLDLPKLRVDGPFGTLCSNEFLDNEVLLMIGAGIGVTPFASVLKEIWHTIQQPGYRHKLKRVRFVWIARNTESFEWFQDVIESVEQDDFRHLLDIQIYLTGNRGSESQMSNLLLNGNQGDLDPITRLRTKTKFGRPNISQLFTQIYQEEQSINITSKSEVTNVGVFYCGPQALGHQLRMESHKQSDDKVRFYFSKEIF